MKIGIRAVLWLALAAGSAADARGQATESRVARAMAGLRPGLEVSGRPPVRWTLAERMTFYKVPGVSIALVDGGRVAWARGFGLKQVGTADSVTATTLFQAASISKPVSGTATLHLVDKGVLKLDENVNTYLKSWKVPDNQFTVNEKVTLRRIMSHSAGLSVHGFPGYLTTDPLPTVPQVLDGTKPIANTDSVRVVAVPGTEWSYSGGGTTMMQLLLTDVTGKTFPALMKEYVLGPAGMTLSTYEQPLPQARAPEAASAHLANGTMIPGHWHVYPEMAPAGLWATPTDLLHWAREIAATRAGRSTKLFSRSMANEMLTVQKAPTGLGPWVEGTGRQFRFGHGGDNAGFHADLIYLPELGQGLAIMTNGDQGQELIGEIKRAIAGEFGWTNLGPRTVTVVPLDSTALNRVAGNYLFEYEHQQIPSTITLVGGKLTARSPLQPAGEELLPLSDLTFISADRGYEYQFGTSGSDRVTTLVIKVGEGLVLKGTRKP